MAAGRPRPLPAQRRLHVEDLEIRLRESGEVLLDKVHFWLNEGEIFALVGESGSGKSISSLATMRLLPEALRIAGGKVLFEGRDLFALTERQMQAVRGARVAMIFQDAMSSLNPVQRVGEQIAEALRRHGGLEGAALRRRVVALLEEVAMPEAPRRARCYPHELSGGQQQRAMIAMALACEPDVLLADEPTTALDATIQKQVLALLRQLTRTRKLAVLLITHDMGVVRHTADQVGVMYRGRIVERAPVRQFFANPRQDYSRRLIDSLPDLDRYRASAACAPLLEVEELRVHFPIRRGVLQRAVDHTRAVDGASLAIGEGETYALVGESGCGKTSLGRAILNLEKPAGGSIRFRGERIDGLSRAAMLPFRRRIQVIFQNPFSSMNPRMTVGAIIEEGMASLVPGMTPERRRERALELLERVRLLAEHRGRYPHELSGGQLQRVAIARALAIDPQLIICDEPTSALDVSIRAEVLELLQEMQRAYRMSYLFITHDLAIVPSLAHRVGVMRAGRIVEQGETERVLTRPRHEYTRVLLDSIARA